MLQIMDPTITTARERIPYAPRPRNLQELRIALIENTRRNSEALLQHLGRKLEAAYRMKTAVLLHKHQRAPLSDAQLGEFAGRVDFAIAGIGD